MRHNSPRRGAILSLQKSRRRRLLAFALAGAWPAVATAQTETASKATQASDDADMKAIEDALLESVAEPEKPPPEKEQELPDIGEDVLEVFVLDRGFYLSTDLGIFLTLGGTRGYSNVQPFLSIAPGFDLGDYLGIQLDLSLAYASGNPISNADRKAGHPSGINNLDATGDFSLLNVGVELVAAWRPTTRLAIEPKVGGGYTFIDPPLTDPSSTTGSVSKVDGSGGHFVVGVDFKYLTLLTNFTAGAALNFHGYLGGWGFIPAISVAAVVRYTFWAM